MERKTEPFREYLLGRLDHVAHRQVEERLVADPSLLDDLHAVEDELVAAYAAGDLEPGDRVAFERHFPTTESRRRKLAAAGAPAAQVEPPGPPPTASTTRPIPWGAAAAATILAITAAAAALFWISAVPRDRVEEEPVPPELQPSVPDERPREQPPQPEPPPTLASLRLSPEAYGATAVLELPEEGTGLLLLQLELPEATGSDYRGYAAEVLTGSGRAVLGYGWPSRSGSDLVLPVDAGLLDVGPHIVRLMGWTPDGRRQPIARYGFSVKRSP